MLENSKNNDKEGGGIKTLDVTNILTTATLFGSEAVLKYLLEKRQEFRRFVNISTKAVINRADICDAHWGLIISEVAFGFLSACDFKNFLWRTLVLNLKTLNS